MLLLSFTYLHRRSTVLKYEAEIRNASFHSKYQQMPTDQKDTQEYRLWNIQEQCKRYSKRTGRYGEKDLFIVYGAKNLMICTIPKAGTHFLREVLNQEFGLNTDFNRKSKNFTDNVLHHFTKAMFVRHPIDRLWSAYVDKFVKFMPLFVFTKEKGMVRKLHPSVSDASLRCGGKLTFQDLLTYILSTKDPRHLDRHIRPYTYICGPCNVSYDFIGKLETSKEDVKALLQSFNISSRQSSFSASSDLDGYIQGASRNNFLREKQWSQP